MLIASVVDWEALGKVVIAAFVAGVGVTSTYAVAIVGATRLADYRRDGRTGAAVAYGLLALIALAACITALVLGIVVMTDKD